MAAAVIGVAGVGTVIRRHVLLGGASLLAGCVTGAAPQTVSVETFDIWPGAPPGGEGVSPKEQIIERSKDPARPDRAIIHVRRPTLKVFRPVRPDGSAVLVCPGGAYQRVVLDKEGDETAMRLAQSGVTAAVLIYRLPEDDWAAGWQAPLQDAQRAMRLLRYGRVGQVDPRRVGVLGFSAGGHLAAALTLMRGKQTYAGVDAADGRSADPDFAALIYAAYLNGSGSAAVTKSPGGAAPDLVGLVDERTPPVFLVHAEDDPSVPVAGSRRMFAALQAKGVPSELHVYPEGGHGFGIAKAKGLEAEAWPDAFLAWGRARGVFG